jgi:hypothetical protein
MDTRTLHGSERLYTAVPTVVSSVNNCLVSALLNRVNIVKY